MDNNTDILHKPPGDQTLGKSEMLIAVGINPSESACIDHLRNVGYIIETFTSTEGIRDQISYQIPNVLLLDIDHLKSDAIKLTKQLKDSPLTYTMPIIIVIGTRNIENEMKCLDVGAEDYLAKPIDPPLLAARIKNSTRRNIRLQISNPLTGLPGTTYIEEQAAKRLEKKIPTAMCYVDIVEFKAFNDKYGYNRGDTVIKLLANVLNEVVASYCETGDFVGHIGGDDFILIIQPAHIEEVCQYINECFDTLIPFQYDTDDMRNQYIVSKSRQGKDQFFPFMALSIGVVTNTNREIESYLIMTELVAEMKSFCKREIKSSKDRKSQYKIDQRSD